MKKRSSTEVSKQLANVRWIGGGSGAGKSTIARRLAAEHDLLVYDSDAAIRDHVDRSDPSRDPLLHAFLAMDMDQRWVNRSPDVMMRTFHGFSGEGFHRIVEDLLALPREQLIIAEGFRLLPQCVAPLLTDPPSCRVAGADARISPAGVGGSALHLADSESDN